MACGGEQESKDKTLGLQPTEHLGTSAHFSGPRVSLLMAMWDMATGDKVQGLPQVGCVIEQCFS